MATYTVKVSALVNGSVTQTVGGPFTDLPTAQNYVATQSASNTSAGNQFAIKVLDDSNNVISYQVNGLFIAD
jgi:hypothetical protein